VLVSAPQNSPAISAPGSRAPDQQRGHRAHHQEAHGHEIELHAAPAERGEEARARLQSHGVDEQHQPDDVDVFRQGQPRIQRSERQPHEEHGAHAQAEAEHPRAAHEVAQADHAEQQQQGIGGQQLDDLGHASSRQWIEVGFGHRGGSGMDSTRSLGEDGPGKKGDGASDGPRALAPDGFMCGPKNHFTASTSARRPIPAARQSIRDTLLDRREFSGQT
jgi:hypothetical protein